MTTEYDDFVKWLFKLSQADQAYLRRHKDWLKAFQKAQKSKKLPDGFQGWTMEMLEGGSESEI